MNADWPQATADENGKRNAANVSEYLRGAGPVPNYADDLVAAQRYHDDLVLWFWSTYSAALAELNRNQPFAHDVRRVIDRIRFKALRPAPNCEAV